MAPAFPSVLPLRVTFRTAEPQRLPPFLGSALHGTLARALHHTVCVFPKRPRCPGCPLYARCTYPALFETPANGDETLRAAGIRDQAPRPLVLAPEPGWTRPSGHPFALAAEAEIPVRITLIGRATADLPILVVALQRTATRGLGLRNSAGDEQSTPRRAALRLMRITTAEGEHVIYDAATDAFSPPPERKVRPESIRGARTVSLTFVTPVRLKHQGRFLTTIAPPDLVAALARRANALSVLHGCGKSAIAEPTAIELAAGLVVEACRLRRVHVTRYSARQRQRMRWPGVMGEVRWQGDALRDLRPLLRFGELVQVGKGAALGFGRYEIRCQVPGVRCQDRP
ncbi:MAG: CRISPR system precrRNA processing endoribonuclease RAMP protein Cas6 [Candidatus Binatia bacterium]